MIEALQTLLQNQVFVGIGGATVMGALMYVAREAPHRLWRYIKAVFSVSVEMSNADEPFRWMVHWLSQQPYAARARRLRLDDGGNNQPRQSGDDEVRPRFLLSPGYGLHFFMYQGVPVMLARNKADGGNAEGSFRPKETMTLRTFARSRTALMSIINSADSLANRKSEDSIKVFAFDYDHWCEAATHRKRQLSSVVLKDGLGEVIADDLRRFLGMGEWYNDRGIPWRRGYLLYGPPGTGKSSLVAALASEFGMSVAIMSIHGCTSDDRLMFAMRRQPANSILLMEDVDAAIQREGKDDERVSFSALLNSLDGIAAPEGRVVIMTTNHIAKLDPALIRPGRIDRRWEIGLATAGQAARMFERYYNADGTDFGRYGAGLAPARIQELLLSAGSPIEAMSVVTKERAA